MNIEDHVILVDDRDSEIGTAEKLEAHQKGLKHRAFSILVFNKRGQLLIHQRAKNKYHSNSLWTNACCSHPRPGESILKAGHRRLQEEMGFDCSLTYQFSISYKAELDNDLIENEYDHILTGIYDGEIKPNPLEVSDYKFLSVSDIKNEISQYPEQYTEWFKIIINHSDMNDIIRRVI